jgi:hypothetical protein
VRLAAVLLSAGCSFSPGQLASREDAGDRDALGDGSVDTVPGANCYQKWFDGTIRFGTPTLLANVNANGYDRDPFLTADELVLYFSSVRDPDNLTGDMLVAKRPSTGVPFAAAQTESEFSSTGFESKVSITADGRYAVIGSDRAGSMLVDVWAFERDLPTDPWGTATQTHLTAVNSADYDHDPTISADGLRLYLAPNPGVQRIAVATRLERDDDFGAPQILTALDSGMGDADPSPTPDERILVFASSRTAPVLLGNIWYATRNSTSGVFGTPVMVPDVNTELAEGDPHLSTDGCRLYFDREVNAVAGDWDLFVATAQP